MRGRIMKQKISWKTTLCGLVSVFSVLISEPDIANALLQSNNPQIQTIGHILLALGVGFGFYFSKDKEVKDD